LDLALRADGRTLPKLVGKSSERLGEDFAVAIDDISISDAVK